MSDELTRCATCGSLMIGRCPNPHCKGYPAAAAPDPTALIRAALEEAAGPIYKWSIAAAEEIEALADDPEAIERIIKAAEGRT